jgi:hypothetical protein
MSKSLEKVGEVTHYFTKISVAVVDVSAPMKIGDRIEGKNIEEADAGDDIGMKVDDRVRKGDIVYRLAE